MEREALHQLQEKVKKKAKREARIKKMKDEQGSARWRTKRKVSLQCVSGIVSSKFSVVADNSTYGFRLHLKSTMSCDTVKHVQSYCYSN